MTKKQKYYYPDRYTYIMDKYDMLASRIVWFIVGFLSALIFIAFIFFEQINNLLDFGV